MAEDPCALIDGPAKPYCERGKTDTGGPPGEGGLDGYGEDMPPGLGGMWDPVGNAADWVADQSAALYRQMDRLMMSSASPLGDSKGEGIAGIYNPISGLSLLIGTIVLLGGLICWMARPSGPNFRKTGQAGGRYLVLILLSTAAPTVIAIAAYGLGQFSTILYADVADRPFRGMEATMLGSDANPWGRFAQGCVVVLSIGPLWLMREFSPLAVLLAMVFLPLAAAFGVAKGWWQSETFRRLLHLVGAVFLVPVPVSVVLMLRPTAPEGPVTDLMLTAGTGAVCLYGLLKLPSLAKKAVAKVTQMPKVKAQTEGTTAVTKMPADRERKVHAKNLAEASGQTKPSGKGSKQPGAAGTSRSARPITLTEGRSRRVRVADVPARPAVRDGDAQAPAYGG
ncbi:hypothetical protein [Streptomyces sp. Da 82-17]|uniref:hypothetical protein n=1 Tax=Streptomyces sp. Da 82-17 TaxID=3377116 RepID=UPI0038D3858D